MQYRVKHFLSLLFQVILGCIHPRYYCMIDMHQEMVVGQQADFIVMGCIKCEMISLQVVLVRLVSLLES